ncbi:ATP-binding protein, partial [Streptomyces sp. TRM76130]|nr:ATP-binding protein [Streptomyces sp. TRM76130]
RRGVVEVLDLTLTRRGGVVIAPMTVTEAGPFAETVGALRALGHDVRHVTLLADRATVLRRLRERGVDRALRYAVGRDPGPRRESWAVRRLDHCLERLREPEFAEHLWTDRTTVPETADRVAALAGLRLRPNTEGRLRTRVRQVGIGLRHIRLD